jgi:hypothetical protein
MGEGRPAGRLPDEGHLLVALHLHRRLESLVERDEARAGERGEGRPAVAHDLRGAVAVAAERGAGPGRDAEFGEVAREVPERMFDVGVLRVRHHAVDVGVGLGVLQFEPRHEQPRLAVGADEQGDRTLGRRERETAEVEDPVVGPPDGAAEALRDRVAERRLPTGAVRGGRDGAREVAARRAVDGGGHAAPPDRAAPPRNALGSSERDAGLGTLMLDLRGDEGDRAHRNEPGRPRRRTLVSAPSSAGTVAAGRGAKEAP